MRERKKELEALLDFSNAEIGSMEASEITTLAYNCRLFEADSSWQSFVFRSATREPDPQDLAMRKRSLLELQSHLRERLEKILEATKTSHDTPILEITAPIVFTAYSLKDRFLLNVKGGAMGEADPQEKEKSKLDLRLVDLVRILGLTPGRFRKCQRRDCDRIFYQSSLKGRVYCSPRCAGAQRQEEFQKKKKLPGRRDLKEGNVII